MHASPMIKLIDYYAGSSGAKKRISFGPSLQESARKMGYKAPSREEQSPALRTFVKQDGKPASQLLHGKQEPAFMATPPVVLPRSSATASANTRKRPAVSQLGQQAHPVFRCSLRKDCIGNM